MKVTPLGLLLFQGLTLATAGGSATFAVTLRDEFGNTLLASDTSGNVAIRHRSSGDIYTDDIITTRSALVGAGGVMDTSYISVTRAGANFSRPDAISVPKLNEEKVLLVKKPNFVKPTQPTKALTPCTANSLHIFCFFLRKATHMPLRYLNARRHSSSLCLWCVVRGAIRYILRKHQHGISCEICTIFRSFYSGFDQ